jgi:hypothetical protein
MNDLIVYGSLMHPAELEGHCKGMRTWPVRVRGYRRSFSQEPSWRPGDGIERGVLTVRTSAGDWFNAILVEGCDAGRGQLDDRERGYARETLRRASVESYGDTIPGLSSRQITLYIGRPEKRNESLLPNREYLGICTDAAEGWGREFAADFMRTTFVGTTTLEEYMQGAGSQVVTE